MIAHGIGVSRAVVVQPHPEELGSGVAVLVPASPSTSSGFARV